MPLQRRTPTKAAPPQSKPKIRATSAKKASPDPDAPPGRKRSPGQQSGKGDPWKNKSAFEIVPFKSKAHYGQVKRFDPELAELRKTETAHAHGGWEKVPFLDPTGPSWTPEKAIGAYASQYKNHIAAGKSHTVAHQLAGLHSTLFDHKGRPKPGMERHAKAAMAKAKTR